MDNHPSRLVNRLVKELDSLCKLGIRITVLKGNHDYVEETEPFFEFLNSSKNITFINTPTLDENEFLYLPHSKTTIEDFNKFLKDNPNADIGCVLMHHTISKADLNDGFNLETTQTINLQKMVDNLGDTLVLSGDVHVPQTLNNVIYIGSPYSINNGDHWRGRAILLNNEQSDYTEILFEDSMCKWRFDVNDVGDLEKILTESDIHSNDTVLVRVNLDYVDSFDFEVRKKEMKNLLDDKKIKNYSIRLKIINKKAANAINTVDYKEQLTPVKKLEAYAEASKLQQPIIDIGIDLLNV
jgi:DNA repair exonuclease SbcCD nuclease subunit